MTRNKYENESPLVQIGKAELGSLRAERNYDILGALTLRVLGYSGLIGAYSAVAQKMPVIGGVAAGTGLLCLAASEFFRHNEVGMNDAIKAKKAEIERLRQSDKLEEAAKGRLEDIRASARQSPGSTDVLSPALVATIPVLLPDRGSGHVPHPTVQLQSDFPAV
jgi:hypothetical protein